MWSRAIIHVDMDAFFASIEQLDHPNFRGKPVAVTNGEQGTCIITASYEARQFGIKVGVRLKEARARCPDLIVCPSRPKRYAELSAKIMGALEAITPDIEVFSVDEAFLDITHCQKLLGRPEAIIEKTKQLVEAVSRLPCSIGLSGDKTTAKFASKQNKPNGLTIIHPNDAESILSQAPVTALCGIGPGIAAFLEKRGVVLCGDMKKLPIGVLAKRFGPLGRRIWLMCQGKDPDPVKTHIKAAKHLGHGKVMPPNTRDSRQIKIYLRHMCEKLAYRLRQNNLAAKTFFIGFRRQRWRDWMGGKICCVSPTCDGQELYQKGLLLLKTQRQGEGLC